MAKACCASCGSTEIKLKDCSACKLVKYCGVKCQREHWQQHKQECKQKAAELRDEILFKQPESSDLGDCPICCLPLPIDPQYSTVMGCCCKVICNGCAHANQKREREKSMKRKCLFCRSLRCQNRNKNSTKIISSRERRQMIQPHFTAWECGAFVRETI